MCDEALEGYKLGHSLGYDTVARRVERLLDLGFSYLVPSNSTPGVPKAT